MNDAANHLHPLFPDVPFKPTYGVRETARRLGFSRHKIHEAIDRGHLQVLRLGPKCIRIPGAELRAFIDANLVDPNA
jgi:excisionase family DNA binding protein